MIYQNTKKTRCRIAVLVFFLLKYRVFIELAAYLNESTSDDNEQDKQYEDRTSGSPAAVANR
jgi:hypothetical protein